MAEISTRVRLSQHRVALVGMLLCYLKISPVVLLLTTLLGALQQFQKWCTWEPTTQVDTNTSEWRPLSMPSMGIAFLAPL